MAYAAELHTALLAVQRAALLTQAVFHRHAKGALAKSDATPVTLGDFGAQTLINHALQRAFPADPIVGEEDADALRADAGLCRQVWELVQDAANRPLSTFGTSSSNGSSSQADGLGDGPENEEAMLAALDRGKGAGGATGRFWTVDPIDGTKGFLRGGQYAVCLALVEDGVVRLGALGCPNLPVSDAAPLTADAGSGDDDALFHPGRGVLFSAVRGQGASSRPLDPTVPAEAKPIHMRQLGNVSEAAMCESFEAAHSDHSQSSQIVKLLGITSESVRMDSQAKYGSVARGSGEIVLRLPVGKRDYKECIWDFAAAQAIVEEAGGVMTDVTGKPLDFSKGRRLFDNTGVITAPKAIHGKVLDAVKKVLAEGS